MPLKGARVLHVLTILAGCLAAATTGLAQPQRAVSPPQIIVPDVTKKSEADARALLKRANLALGNVVARDHTAPQGTVLDQDPDGGAKVRIGSSVNLVVSTGRPPLTEVPDVTRRPEREAREILQRARLAVGDIASRAALTSEGAVVPQGMVVEQDPRSGARVRVGSKIDLVVSTGQPPLMAVPDVTKRPEREAREILQRARLAVGDVASRAALSPEGAVVPQGTVAEQDPRSGTRVRVGAKVDLVVGTGQPPLTAVPDVTKRPEKEAREILHRAKLAVGDVASRAAITPEGAIVPQGTVAEQNPRSGARVRVGTKVDLFVGTGAGSLVPPKESPNVEPSAPPAAPTREATSTSSQSSPASAPSPERKRTVAPSDGSKAAVVPPSKRPSIVVLAANRTSVTSRDEVTFTISVEPRDLTLEYRVLFGDTEETAWTDAARTTHTYRHKGRYTARAFARESPGADIHSEPLVIDVTDPVLSIQTLVGGAFLMAFAGTAIYRYAKRQGRRANRGIHPDFVANQNLESVRVETSDPATLQWQLELTAVRSSGPHSLVASDEFN